MENDALILADHCNTVYSANNGYGDIGQNIAENRPGVLGVQDREDFVRKVHEVHREGLTDNKSDALGYILAQETDSLEDIIRKGSEAQFPEDYGDGFVQLCSEGYDIGVVTAGIDEIAKNAMEVRMNGYSPEVIGTSLGENEGINVSQYCSGEKKIDRIKQAYGKDALEKTIALGNSNSNDGPMMEAAAISIGRGRAYDSAGLYTSDDFEFWTRATLTAIGAELLSGNPRNAREAGLDIAEEAGELEDVQFGGQPGDYEAKIKNIYQDVRSEL